MNRDYVVFNLREAAEELQRTIQRLEADPGYGEPELQIAVEHAYHHLNHAWNARHCSRAESSECSDDNFARWRKFPRDLDPSF
jgi:hypothetical protein